MEQVNCINDILNALEGIEYGWSDINNNTYQTLDKGFKKNYVLATPDEVLKNSLGTCYDIVELERAYFKQLGIKVNTYFMIYYESKKVYTHTFVVYEENEKFYWFEYSWNKVKGIHEYMSLYDLLKDVREKFKKHHNLKFMDVDYLCIYKYKKPKAHLGLKDLYKHCEAGENIII